MKRLLKAFLVVALVLAAAGFSTSAYFTSNVTAADNEITTGTLMVAIDSSREHTDRIGTWAYPYAYNVVEDVNGVNTPGTPFEPWINAEPGTFVPYDNTWERPAGNFSVWVGVRNKGSLNLVYRAYANGRWTDIPRIAQDPTNCSGVGSGDPTLVKVMAIHRYAARETTGCENHRPCQNLRDALYTGPWTAANVSTQNTAGPVAGYFGNDVTLGANEFVIYRVDLQLDETTSNCYQGATYTYDLVGEARQVSGTYAP